MKILVVKLSSLGDLFHALPAVHVLKEGLSAEIDWVTQREYAGLVGCFDDVSRVIVFPRRGLARGLRRFLAELRRERYDLVVDFQGLMKSALVSVAARCGRRIGPSFHREGAGLFYSEVPRAQGKVRHAVEKNLDVVRLLGLTPDSMEFRVTFPALRREVRHPLVAVLPASRWATKTWSARCFAETVRLLVDWGVGTVALLGSVEDRELCEGIAREVGDCGCVVNLAGRMSLEETGGFLREADVLLSNDSGPLHMAAALGTRTVAIFGATDPVRTGPFGSGHRVLMGGLACQPCLSRRCAIGTMACLNEVTPRQAFEAVILGCARGGTCA